jgi:hypothetical protein
VSILETHLENFSVLDLNCDNLTEDSSRNIWENLVKLIKSESLVFTNMSINPIFQILGADKRVFGSRIP